MSVSSRRLKNTVGVKLIKASLQDGTIRPLARLREEMFEEGLERNAFLYCLDYHASHSAVPTLQALANAGHDVSEATTGEPPSYYNERVRHRFLYHQLTDRFHDLGDLLKRRKVEEAGDLIREMGLYATQSSGGVEVADFNQAFAEVRADFQWAKAHPGLRGVTLGFPTLDAMTLGAQSGDLFCAAARTGMGKSWKLAKMSHAGWRSGARVLVITMEMLRLQYMRRVVGLESGLNPMLLRSGELGYIGEQTLERVYAQFTEDGMGNRFHIVGGEFEKSVDGIRPIFDEYDYDIVYIDAAYLLTPPGRKNDHLKTWEQIQGVIRALKKIALKREIPIVISVQLNRNVKKSTTRDIDAGDVAGGDSIPQDVSVLLGLRKPQGQLAGDYRIGQVIKNREGIEGDYAYQQTYDPMTIHEVPMEEVQMDSPTPQQQTTYDPFE